MRNIESEPNSAEQPLVEVVCGVDEYGRPMYDCVPADTAVFWDDRQWRTRPL